VSILDKPRCVSRYNDRKGGGYYGDFNTWQDCSLNTYPTHIILSNDETCNLKCKYCRTHVKVNSKEENNKLSEILHDIVRPALKSCEYLEALNSGEFFASKPILDFYKTLSPDEFPQLKLIILTNGTLFTPERWSKLSNIKGMVDTVRIAVDAGSKDTYELLHKDASWEVFCRNMEYISFLKSEKQIKKIRMTFIISKDNFKEMTDFVDLAKGWSADIISFSRVKNWGTIPNDEFVDYDVFSTQSQHRNEAEKILKRIQSEKSIPVINLYGDY
jgi:wyosine [tRNA(Phe)-imidazoG37] synthetase (radical SAM superfamily)